MMPSVSQRRNAEPSIVAPMVRPSSSVVMFSSSFWAAWLNRSTTLALAQQVAEHQGSDQRSCFGHE